MKKQKKLTKVQLKKIEKRELKKKDLEWQKKVKERDKNKCVICGRMDRINCHHLIPRENKNFRWFVENGIVLCNFHHKWCLEISPHRNSFVFFNWLKEHRKKQLDSLEKKWMFYREYPK